MAEPEDTAETVAVDVAKLELVDVALAEAVETALDVEVGDGGEEGVLGGTQLARGAMTTLRYSLPVPTVVSKSQFTSV